MVAEAKKEQAAAAAVRRRYRPGPICQFVAEAASEGRGVSPARPGHGQQGRGRLRRRTGWRRRRRRSHESAELRWVATKAAATEEEEEEEEEEGLDAEGKYLSPDRVGGGKADGTRGFGTPQSPRPARAQQQCGKGKAARGQLFLTPRWWWWWWWFGTRWPRAAASAALPLRLSRATTKY